MDFDPAAVETVTVDSHGTIVDVGGAAALLDPYVDEPDAVATTWRARSLTYAGMVNHLGHYEPFWTLIDRALDYALEAHDDELARDERESVLDGYLALDAFDDVRPALERLDAAGYDCYVVSNGSPEMLDAMLETAGLEGLVSDAISADEVRAYKVAPAIYEHAVERAGTPAEALLHVSGGWFDACGAMNVGMQGAWVNRDGYPRERWGPTPDLAVGGFDELADALGA